MIYYLAHPYRSCMLQSFENAKAWAYRLIVEKGLTVYAPVIETHPIAAFCDEIGLSRPPEDYWVEQDLKKMNAMAKDGLILLLSKTAYKLTNENLCSPCSDYKGVLSHYDNVHWISKGCQREYAKAKSLGCKVYELESFLEENKKVIL